MTPMGAALPMGGVLILRDRFDNKDLNSLSNTVSLYDGNLILKPDITIHGCRLLKMTTKVGAAEISFQPQLICEHLTKVKYASMWSPKWSSHV